MKQKEITEKCALFDLSCKRQPTLLTTLGQVDALISCAGIFARFFDDSASFRLLSAV